MKPVTTRATWWLFTLLALSLAALALAPGVLIHPFRPQTPPVVAAAYFLRTHGPWITLAGLVASLALAARLARRLTRRWHWAPLALLLALAGGSAWLARQNHFEWLFAPLSDPSYVRAAQADFMADTDMLVAVEIAGDAVAWPVRQMAYHHVLNDVVGGEPVVSTY